jgi:hypothetical protein
MARKTRVKRVLGNEIDRDLLYNVMYEIELILSDQAKNDWKDIVIEFEESDTGGFVEYIIKAPKSKAREAKKALEKIIDGLIELVKIYTF